MTRVRMPCHHVQGGAGGQTRTEDEANDLVAAAAFDRETCRLGTRREPFDFTPMGVNPIPSGPPHVRPMWALSTCGEPDEIKENALPENITALVGD